MFLLIEDHGEKQATINRYENSSGKIARALEDINCRFDVGIGVLKGHWKILNRPSRHLQISLIRGAM